MKRGQPAYERDVADIEEQMQLARIAELRAQRPWRPDTNAAHNQAIAVVNGPER